MSQVKEKLKNAFLKAIEQAEKGQIGLATLSNLYDEVLLIVDGYMWFPKVERDETARARAQKGSDALDEFLKSKKWNSLSEIAETREVNVRKNNKICLDLVDVQGLVYDAISDFRDIQEKKFWAWQKQLEELWRKKPTHFTYMCKHCHERIRFIEKLEELLKL